MPAYLGISFFEHNHSKNQLILHLMGVLDDSENSERELEIKFIEISATKADIVFIYAHELNLGVPGSPSTAVTPVLNLWEKLVNRYFANKQLIYLQSYLEYMLKYNGYPQRHPTHVFTDINS